MAFTDDSVMVNNAVHTERLMGNECRICLKPCTEVCQLFQNNGRIPEKLMAIGAVQVQEGDGLPASICLSCNHLLDVSYDFKCQIQSSDVKLRQLLKLPMLQDNNIKDIITNAMPDVNLKKDNGIEIYSHDLVTSNNTAIINHESPINHDQSNHLCSSMSEDSYTSCDKQEQLMLPEGNKTSENLDDNREVTVKTDGKSEMSLEDNQDVLKQLLGMDNQDVEICSDDEEKPLISRTTGYKCPDCVKSFATHTALMEHAKRKHHYYLCVLCDKYFSDKAKLKKHMFTSHRMTDDETLQESGQDRKINKVSAKVTRSGTIADNTRERNKYICNVCSREFKYHKPFLSHTKNHSACSEKTSDDVFDQSTNKRTNKQKDKTPPSRENKSEDEDEEEDDDDSDLPIESLQCTQCGKLFATKRNLKRHISTHSGLKYNCTTCGKEFSRIDKLKDHEQSKHKVEIFGNTEDEDDDDEDNENKVNENSENRKKDNSHNRPHQCSHCPKAFAQAQSLANHEERHKRAKDTQKRFLCEKCSKCFAQSGSLVAHMRTHTGHRPYVCKVCSRAFTKSTYLQLHLRTHSGEKPYICQYCSRAFARANTLARHITMHTGEAKYCCSICEKKFRRLTSLNEHMYTHTGQRPYACKLCSKRYNNAGSLYAHTKKCKAQQSSSGTTTTFTVSTVDTTPQPTETSMPQLLIYSQRKLEEEPSVDQVMPAPQYLVANVHNQKTIPANVIQPFTMEDPNVYNSKQFKNYYTIYQNM